MNRKESQTRNHNILRLKGMYASARILMAPELAKVVMDAIDTQLTNMGATTPEQDRIRWREEHNL
jgi:hypothetical protein